MNMKKVFALMTAVCLLICGTSIGSSATDVVDSEIFYYNDKNIEVVVEGNNIRHEKKQLIANYIVEEDISTDNDNVSTCGILCIFGHDLTTSHATETTHNAYTTSPKCLVKNYTVQYCNRSSCDYITKELTSSYRTAACHG